MIGTVNVAGPIPPGICSKDQHKQKKEDPGNLKKQNAAQSLERPKKTADAARNAPGSPPRLASRDVYGNRSADAGNRNWARHRPMGRTSLTVPGQPLPGYTARHAHPNAQYPTDGLRFHSDYDGISDDTDRLCTEFTPAQLPSTRRGSKVIKSHAAPRASLALAAASGGTP
jgi:hypothetical protein